ncbi:MAG: arginine--tRNA ligase [Cocleimonas sp.]|nr:arginine--tRNA ligase [Cocleimonas sp.]
MNIRQLIDSRVSQALTDAGVPNDTPAVIKPSNRPVFGDYQANGIMGAAKKIKTNPRELAAKVLDCLVLSDIAEKVEIAGPGFLNIHLKPEWLSQQLDQTLDSKTLNIEQVKTPQTIVVDYSGPNLAKEMHVGHLRSTIIGDAIVRVLEFRGHQVIRQNHVGDWGTQFGMLIAHMNSLQSSSDELSMKLSDLEAFYREAKKRFDDAPDFAEAARDYVVKLQSGDPECHRLWQQFIDISLQHCDDIYARLNVSLNREHVMPESAYNNDLKQVITDLGTADLLTEDQGAKCVFLEDFKGKDDKILPTIVQKSDGGYLYATTDLAALRYRHQTLHANRILYFVDARQSLHLNQVFTIAKKAHFVPEATQLEHLAFGTMMGKDGKPFKTRAGGTVKLIELLKEAEQRALALVNQKNPDLSEAERLLVAQKVGIAAVKYADLSKNRSSDYIFNWDSMLSFEGNTAPYLQYAYARIQSIFRKANTIDLQAALILDEKTEKQLAVKLLQLSETLETVVKDSTPNILCNYLFELAGHFMSFYEACPILKTDNEAMRNSRLKLAHLTATTLKTGLGLLGIDTLDRM